MALPSKHVRPHSGTLQVGSVFTAKDRGGAAATKVGARAVVATGNARAVVATAGGAEERSFAAIFARQSGLPQKGREFVHHRSPSRKHSQRRPQPAEHQ